MERETGGFANVPGVDDVLKKLLTQTKEETRRGLILSALLPSPFASLWRTATN